MRRTITLLLLLGATTLAACGGESEEQQPPARAAAATAVAAADGAVKADIADFAFAPAEIRVEAGQEITWTNSDSATHTVTGDGFDSGTLAQGESFTFTAEKTGTFEYVCALHPAMKGTITVQ